MSWYYMTAMNFLQSEGGRKGLSKNCGRTKCMAHYWIYQNWAEFYCSGWKTFTIKFLSLRNSYDYLPWMSIAQTVISIFLNTTLLYFSDLLQTRFIEVHWEISFTFHNINRLFFSFPYDFLQCTFHFVPLVPYHFQFESKYELNWDPCDALIWNWLDRKAERDLFHLLSFFFSLLTSTQ